MNRRPEQDRGLLLVDKPEGITSHGVVARIRKALNIRRVGHAGTLDPMATGLLLIAVGEATKLVTWLVNHDKEYHATIQLGVETDTLDAEGQPVSDKPIPTITRTDLNNAVAKMIAQKEQTPPKISAIKINGQPMYRLARKGTEVQPTPRAVQLHKLAVEQQGTQLHLSMRCSKGYYVRALARDLSIALNTVGHITALRRTKVADFAIEQAIPLPNTAQGPQPDAELQTFAEIARKHLLPLHLACPQIPTLDLNEQEIQDARNGKVLSIEKHRFASDSDDWRVLLLGPGREVVAMGKRSETTIRVVRGFNLV